MSGFREVLMKEQKRRKPFVGIASAVIGLLFSMSVSAFPITYVLETLDASGTLDGSVFGVSDVTFTLNADTIDVDPAPGFGVDQAIVASSATVQLGAGPILDILSPIGLYSAANDFGLWRPSSLNLLDSSGFGPDLTMATPTTAVNYSYLQWALSPPITTSAGIIIFDNSSNVPGTYTALMGTAVPAPAPLVLICLGLFAIRLRRNS